MVRADGKVRARRCGMAFTDQELVRIHLLERLRMLASADGELAPLGDVPPATAKTPPPAATSAHVAEAPIVRDPAPRPRWPATGIECEERRPGLADRPAGVFERTAMSATELRSLGQEYIDVGNQMLELADRLAGIGAASTMTARGLVSRTVRNHVERTPPKRRAKAGRVADDELDNDDDDAATLGVNIGKIVAFLRNHSEGARTGSIADATGIGAQNIATCCRKHPELVEKIGYGMWKLGPKA